MPVNKISVKLTNKALILPGWFQDPNSCWYPWLANELNQRKIESVVLDIPTMQSNSPDLNIQIDYVLQNYEVNANTIIVGHSLGGVLALRIAEKRKIDRLFLVSTWDFNELTPNHQSFWQTPIDHSVIRKNTNSIYCVFSDNDPYFSEFQFRNVAKRLDAKEIFIPNGKHFREEDGFVKIEEIIKYL